MLPIIADKVYVILIQSIEITTTVVTVITIIVVIDRIVSFN